MMTDQVTEAGLPLEEELVETEDETNEESEEAKAEKETAERHRAAAEAAAAINIAIPTPKAGGAPPWVMLPGEFKFPRGKQIIFIRFKSSWTDTPWKGEPLIDPNTGSAEVDENGEPVLYRQCVCWPINTADKKLALSRAQRDPNRAADELAKQMVRVHDGVEADWGTVRGNGIEMFWNELGEKCRGLILRMFTQLHVLDTNSTRDFLQNCIEVRSTGS